MTKSSYLSTRSGALAELAPLGAVLALAIAACDSGPGEYDYARAYESDPIAQLREIKQQLAQGWNTWNTRSVTSHVLLPEGFAINLAFKQHYWLDERHLAEPLVGRWTEPREDIRPGPHAWDGSYTGLELHWEQIHVRVESAHDGQDVVILVTPLEQPSPPAKLIVEAGLLWNRPGQLARDGDALRAETQGRDVTVHITAEPAEDPFVPALSPYLPVPLDGEIGISTGVSRSLDEIRRVVARERAALEEDAAEYGELAEAFLAIQAGIAWNVVYDPKGERVLSTVGRLWNDERGGWGLFGWDNFFLPYVIGLDDRELALATVIEHLRGATEEGFMPNDNQANDRKSWDHSQPPVGGIMVRELYRQYPERWFLEAAFEPLVAWNRWWPRKRLNEGLLSYGSHEAKNPFNERHRRNRVAAGWESGMDDSPMYEGVPFNQQKNTLELQDVGLNSLYIADCEALAELAEILGREEEAAELRERADAFRERMESLWDEEVGLYLNYRTDLDRPSLRLSPTLFYPLLAQLPSQSRAERMIEEHFYNPNEFWGDWIVPTIARNDPSFSMQRYWKGAIWPPTNFLTYLSLRKYGMAEAHETLAARSLEMFLTEYRRRGYVSENYSAITGTGDDPRLSSDNFHAWGVLFGFMSFIESGAVDASELEVAQ